MTKVLIVEDEPPISNLIRLSLTKNGYACKCVFDGMEAADFLEKERTDLILLDVMLPKLDGFELMEYIRPLNIPVIFLTAKNAVDDRVKGLRMGAEDYIVKPFEIAELLARVEVVLRRYGRSEDLIQMDGLRIDVRSMRVERNGIEIGAHPQGIRAPAAVHTQSRYGRCTGRPSMSGCGAASWSSAARQWISMSSACEKK